MGRRNGYLSRNIQPRKWNHEDIKKKDRNRPSTSVPSQNCYFETQGVLHFPEDSPGDKSMLRQQASRSASFLEDLAVGLQLRAA